MKRTSYLLLFAGVMMVAPVQAEDWTHFRGGSDGGSAAAKLKVPADLDLEKSVAWKVELPGRGPGSPIVVGDKVFVTASMGAKDERLITLCFDVASGKQIWRRQAWATGRTASHETSANAAPTPASDGERIYAFYSSNDLICYDLDGNLQWFRGLAYDFPKAGNDIGMSSSPVVADGVVVVQIDSQGDAFAIGLNAKTGETLWRNDRDRKASWCSPVILPKVGDRPATVVIQSPGGLGGFDLHTGKELWKYEESCDGISSPVVGKDYLYVPSGGVTALQIPTGTSTPVAEVAWTSPKMRPGAASPVVADGKVFVVNRSGVLSAASAKDGEQLWQLRLKGSFWSTPAYVNGHMILFGHGGIIQVVKLADEDAEAVGSLDIQETIQASPAFCEDGVFVRTDGHLRKLKF